MRQRSIGLFPPFRFDHHHPPGYRKHRWRRLVDDLPEDKFEDWMAAAADVRTNA